jgi:hypothetical protein
LCEPTFWSFARWDHLAHEIHGGSGGAMLGGGRRGVCQKELGKMGRLLSLGRRRNWRAARFDMMMRGEPVAAECVA